MIFLFTIFMLLGSAFKDDREPGFATASAASCHPIFEIIRSLSPAFVAVAAVIGGLIFAGSGGASIKKNPVLAFFIALISLAAIRSFFFGFDVGVKVLGGGAISAFTIVVYQKKNAKLTQFGIVAEILTALRAFSIIFILMNMLNYISGYGFAPGNSRLFGTASHPNFLGVQLAVCNLALLSWVLKKTLLRIPVFFIAFAGIWMQLLTGSRTALLMLVVGVSVYLYMQSTRRYRMLIFQIAAVVLVSCAFTLLLPQLGNVFDRGDGGGDTRSAVWLSMLQAGIEHPFVGSGNFEGHTENSFLRAFAAYGIFYALGLFGLVATCVWKLMKGAIYSPGGQHAFCAALAASLFVGSVLEGYLMDAWSFPKMAFIILIVMCGQEYARRSGGLARISKGRDPSNKHVH